jgi:pimeloyl-ACP methyl ester carboxylesterase
MWGMEFFMTYCYDELVRSDLSKQITDVGVPLYFFLGRHDCNAPATLAEQYFQAIKAPEKKLIWFEHSAHYPFLEEIEKFNYEVKAIGQLAL